MIKGSKNASVVLANLSQSTKESIINKSYEKGIEIRFKGYDYSGTHRIGEPKREDGIKEAEKIIEEVEKKDVLFHYRIKEIFMKFDHYKTAGYYYGILDLLKCPIYKTSKFIVLQRENTSNIGTEEYKHWFAK